MDNMNFNIDKALKLSLDYRKERDHTKHKFIELLISYQRFYGDISIVGCALSTPIYYDKTIVETVLNDLGYKLINFNYTKYKDLHEQTYILSTNFSFIVKEDFT